MSTRRELRKAREEIGELLESHGADRGLEEFSRYENDPVGFAADVLNVELWEPKQAEIARSVRDHRRTVVQGSNAAGKDFAGSVVALWAVYARQMYVIVTASAERTAGGVFMRREVQPQFTRADDLPGELYSMELRIPGSRAGIRAMTSTTASKLTGFHHPHGVLTILSEAQDVPPFAWEAMDSNTTGEKARALAMGNPLRPDGRFFEVARKDTWNRIRIPATEHPNVVEGEEVIPGGPTETWIEDMAAEWGRDSPQFTARVDSEFPDVLEEGLFRRSWLDEAADRHESRELRSRDLDELVVGVDVGRRGPDQTILAIRRGREVRELREVGDADPLQTAERVEEVLQEIGFYTGDEYVQGGTLKKVPKVGTVVVDAIGVGSRLADPLQKAGYQVVEYKGSKSPGDGEKFLNLRAESYWHLRNLLEDGGIALPRDEELFEELLAISWSPTGQGKIQMEAKADVKKKIRRSPDRADAVAMAFHPEGQGHTPPPTVDEIGVLQK